MADGNATIFDRSRDAHGGDPIAPRPRAWLDRQSPFTAAVIVSRRRSKGRRELVPPATSKPVKYKTPPPHFS